VLKFFLAIFLFARLASGAELFVSAASSLTDALLEVGKKYEEESGQKIIFNFGASSILARQIEESAPVDLFFSADEEKMDRLDAKNLIDRDTRTVILSNILVVVAGAENKVRFKTPGDLLKARTIAIAEPHTVPAGIYAKTYLQNIGLWEQIKDRLIPVENVRAALATVEAGNAEAAIVYKTDALLSKRVTVAFEITGKSAPNIKYPAACLRMAKNSSAAKQFLKFLQSPEASETFRKYGFIVLTKK